MLICEFDFQKAESVCRAVQDGPGNHHAVVRSTTTVFHADLICDVALNGDDEVGVLHDHIGPGGLQRWQREQGKMLLSNSD